MYHAVLDGRRAVMASGAKSHSRTKIDDHNDHQEKGKTATMAVLLLISTQQPTVPTIYDYCG
jgi:hypothetical protein